MKKNPKHKLIEDLIKECKADGEKVFDQLLEKSEQYLTKLLQVSKAL